MIQLIADYQLYVKNIKEYIDNSPYKTSFFIKKLGLSKPTFYRKMRKGSFTVEEIDVITKLLYPREAILKELAESEKDIEESKVYEHQQAMTLLRKQYDS